MNFLFDKFINLFIFQDIYTFWGISLLRNKVGNSHEKCYNVTIFMNLRILNLKTKNFVWPFHAIASVLNQLVFYILQIIRA